MPHWTTEPEFDSWCDPANPEASLEEDTQRQIELGNSFADKVRSEYSGAKLRWAEMVFARHANLREKGKYKSGRSPHKLNIWDKPVDNFVLALMPDLPVRNKAGGIIETQPRVSATPRTLTS